MTEATDDGAELEDAIWGRVDKDGSMRTFIAGFDALRKVPWLGRRVLKWAGLDPHEVDELVAAPRRLVTDMATAIRAFATLGWAYSGLAPTPVYDKALAAMRAGASAEDAQEILTEGWPEYFKHFLLRISSLGSGDEKMSEIIRRRRSFIDRALAHHEAGAYEASVPIVLAQIDGICNDLTGKDFFTQARRNAMFDDETVAGLPENLDVVRTWFSKPIRRSASTGHASRHGVMHGRELAYDTKQNSVKALALLLAVIEWAQPKARAEAESRADEREQRFAGSTGVDVLGRRLDRRGFSNAKDSLRRLSGRQMAEYRRNGGYSSMEEMFPDASGDDFLLGQDEITLAVSDDRQAFGAWRRTPTGFIFGVGGIGGPPVEWLYESEEPPTDLPGGDKRWSRFGADPDCPNW